MCRVKRWIAQSLLKGFRKSQRRAHHDVQETVALKKTTLPSLTVHLEDARREMSGDNRPCGLERNRLALSTFLCYRRGRGLSMRLMAFKKLFFPESLYPSISEV